MKNRIHRKKLLHSKWTAVQPRNKEKHFLITKVTVDADGTPESCVLTAVHSCRESEVDWRDFEDSERWQVGWQN